MVGNGERTPLKRVYPRGLKHSPVLAAENRNDANNMIIEIRFQVRTPISSPPGCHGLSSYALTLGCNGLESLPLVYLII